jgi:predicted dehydrogenase
MTHKVRWGVLGAARIATKKVIPAMQRGEWSEVTAIASRDLGKAQDAAALLGIPKAYGSYEALLADRDIEAVYNPLPNHLHLPWSIRAAESGKHVLCEKPIGLNVADAERLLAVRDRTGMTIQEAFMVRTHPQWRTACDLVSAGRIGEVRAMMGFFSYSNVDPANIRNVAEYGGGALLDIGCYLIHTARMIFRREPDRVTSTIDRDPVTGIDRLTSMILDFGGGHAIGTCSTQLVPYQRVHIFGTRARIEIQIPFNAPPDTPTRIFLDDGADLSGAAAQQIDIPACDQYTIQADLFSCAIREDAPPIYPLEDSIANMRAIDAVLRGAR